jgi:hypothetical protein
MSPDIAASVETDVAIDPGYIALFGIQSVMEQSKLGADLLDKFHGSIRSLAVERGMQQRTITLTLTLTQGMFSSLCRAEKVFPVMSRSARIGKKNVQMLLIERKRQTRLAEGVGKSTNRVSQHIVAELLVGRGAS